MEKVSLVIVHIKYLQPEFVWFLMDKDFGIDWSKDKESVLSQLPLKSYAKEDIGTFYKEPPSEVELYRTILKEYASELHKESLAYHDILSTDETYYVDLVHWDNKPPVKLTSEFQLVSFLFVRKSGDWFELSLSDVYPYKDVGTHELEALKEKLAIKSEIDFFNRVFVEREGLEDRVKAIKNEQRMSFTHEPVLVYMKDNETELRESLKETALYEGLFF